MSDNRDDDQLGLDALKTMTDAEITKATTTGRLNSLLSGEMPPPVVDDAKLKALKARLETMTDDAITKATRNGEFDADLRDLHAD